jgi:hypothetical protein
MLMQPRPRAETSRLLFPSLRFCILNPFFELNVEANLHRRGVAVALNLARPVVILLESAGRMRCRNSTQRRQSASRKSADWLASTGQKKLARGLVRWRRAPTPGKRPTKYFSLSSSNEERAGVRSRNSHFESFLTTKTRRREAIQRNQTRRLLRRMLILQPRDEPVSSN